jgi:hypothetical protein
MSMWDGFPLGRWLEILSAIRDDRPVPQAAIDAMEAWRASKQPKPASIIDATQKDRLRVLAAEMRDAGFGDHTITDRWAATLSTVLDELPEVKST